VGFWKRLSAAIRVKFYLGPRSTALAKRSTFLGWRSTAVLATRSTFRPWSRPFRKTVHFPPSLPGPRSSLTGCGVLQQKSAYVFSARKPRIEHPKVFMILLVRDEADTIDLFIRYHSRAGIDALIVTDN
jgi:hypothetical protein